MTNAEAGIFLDPITGDYCRRVDDGELVRVSAASVALDGHSLSLFNCMTRDPVTGEVLTFLPASGPIDLLTGIPLSQPLVNEPTEETCGMPVHWNYNGYGLGEVGMRLLPDPPVIPISAGVVREMHYLLEPLIPPPEEFVAFLESKAKPAVERYLNEGLTLERSIALTFAELIEATRGLR
jgi:hypothetical protein